MRVSSEEDSESFIYANGTRDVSFQGAWLSYRVRSNYHQRVSPAGSTGNDWVDLLNALMDGGVTVEIFPIYSIDPTNSVEVILSPESRREMLSVNRSLFVPDIAFKVDEKARRTEYPDWLRVTRTH
ncbi:MAG: hypothetical protein LC650_03430 [Actinobacteria bacterium]|nr:hypothetical protein [Actinomycetota bacterium]